ncbi:MAG: hypothetical protein ACYDG6_12540 [Thermincolia bacterium]
MAKSVLKCDCGFRHISNEFVVFTRDLCTKKILAFCSQCQSKLNIKNYGNIKIRL